MRPSGKCGGDTIRWRRTFLSRAAATRACPTPRAVSGITCRPGSVGSRRAILGFVATSESGSGFWERLEGAIRPETLICEQEPFHHKIKRFRKKLARFKEHLPRHRRHRRRTSLCSGACRTLGYTRRNTPARRPEDRTGGYRSSRYSTG